ARFARLIVEEKPAPPPPPPARQEETRPLPEQLPEPVARELPPAAQPQQQTSQPAAPQSTARERAARSGLLALSQDLAAMRSATITQELESRPLRDRASTGARGDAPAISGHNT